MYQGRDHLFILRLEHAVYGRVREGCVSILDIATVKKNKSICSLRKCFSIQNCPISSFRKHGSHSSSKAN